MIDKIRSMIGSSGNEHPQALGDGGEETEQIPEEVAQQMQKYEQEIQQLREQQKEGQDEVQSRAAKIEEQQQEEVQRRKKIEQQLEQKEQELQELKQEQRVGSTTQAAPDSEHLKGLPVVSADGNKFFGLFTEWINSRGKIGIKTRDPNDSKVLRKVGWGDEISEFVVDANTLRQKDVIIVKLDGNEELMDIAPVGRHQDIIQEKKNLNEKVNRLSHELDQAIEMKRENEDRAKRLTTALAMTRMKLARAKGNPGDAVAIARMSDEMDMMGNKIESQSERLARQRGNVDDLIEEYEEILDREFEELGRSGKDRLAEEFGDMMDSGMEASTRWLDQMPEETRESIERSLHGDGGGAKMEIVEDEN